MVAWWYGGGGVVVGVHVDCKHQSASNLTCSLLVRSTNTSQKKEKKKSACPTAARVCVRAVREG